MSTVPPACGGVTAVIWVAESTVNEAAGNPPNETAVAPVKPVPVIVTLYPPATGPPGGITLVIAGAVADRRSGVLRYHC